MQVDAVPGCRSIRKSTPRIRTRGTICQSDTPSAQCVHEHPLDKLANHPSRSSRSSSRPPLGLQPITRTRLACEAGSVSGVRTGGPHCSVGTSEHRRREWPARDWAVAATPRAKGGRVATVCAHCGVAFHPRRRDARFCSRTCRSRHWRATTRRCATCHRPLPASLRRDARYCSARCRRKAWRARQAGGGAR